MLRFLAFASLATLVSAGGRTLGAQESAQFLALFRRYCGSPGAGPAQDGNTFFYCKTSDQTLTQTLTHESEISPGETPKQVIFIQPPPTNYIHNVALRGSPGNPQETEIYVLPQSADHQLQLQDTRSSVQAVKPSLYFLSNDNQQQPGNNLPPINRQPGQQGGNNGGNRPSAPPPGSTNPNVIGVGTGIVGGGYQAYGAPGVLSPRNQRNVPQYRTL